jgi:inorganic pyrophosphatase
MTIVNTIKVLIETPKGSRNKYTYDFEAKQVYLKKVLPMGMVFPFDFGSVPGTKAEDGDPLDALVLIDEPVFPGCMVECVVIGVLEATQTKERKTIRNDRLIAVMKDSLQYAHVKQIKDLGSKVMEQIENFFINYNKAAGKKFKIIRRGGQREAMNILKEKSALTDA